MKRRDVKFWAAIGLTILGVVCMGWSLMSVVDNYSSLESRHLSMHAFNFSAIFAYPIIYLSGILAKKKLVIFERISAVVAYILASFSTMFIAMSLIYFFATSHRSTYKNDNIVEVIFIMLIFAGLVLLTIFVAINLVRVFSRKSAKNFTELQNIKDETQNKEELKMEETKNKSELTLGANSNFLLEMARAGKSSSMAIAVLSVFVFGLLDGVLLKGFNDIVQSRKTELAKEADYASRNEGRTDLGLNEGIKISDSQSSSYDNYRLNDSEIYGLLALRNWWILALAIASTGFGVWVIIRMVSQYKLYDKLEKDILANK